VRGLRPLQLRPGLDPTVALAALATVFVSFGATRYGPRESLGVLLVALLFTLALIGFVAAPRIAVAATIVLFVTIPALKVFTTPLIGSLKDLDTAAAVCAAIVVSVLRRRVVEPGVLGLIALLLGIYVINAGGGHGVAWAQGVRLAGEPLLLLAVGLSLPDPRRTMRAAIVTLVVSAAAVAFYGIVQQVIGGDRLVALGYAYGDQVRTASGHLRSFGTLDDPFAYAAYLLLGLAALLFGMRRGPWTRVALWLIVAGLAASLVRTGLILCVTFVGILLLRRQLWTSGLMIAAAAAVAGVVLLVAQGSATETRTIPLATSTGSHSISSRPGVGDVILNGRVSAWKAAIGDAPAAWAIGRGVGVVGTAAARSGYSLAPAPTGDAGRSAIAVDSGYLATLADVGMIGLAVFLALLARLFMLASAAARRQDDTGWFALALLSGLVLDALTRASFTGFPTAFIGLLVVGIALAAAREQPQGT
jgi:hypothetical protein